MKVTFTDIDQQSVDGRTARAVNRSTGEVHTVTIAGGEADFGQLTYQQAYEVYGVTTSGARVTQVLVKTETNEPSTPSEPPQSAPSLSATAVSGTWIGLTIGSVSGATGYEYRVDGGTPVDVGTNRTPQVTGLTAETQYSFEARAYNAEGAGPWSSVVQATTQAESSLDPVVQAYVDAVNAARLAESQSPMAQSEIDKISEFWARLGNSNSELSADLRSKLIGAVFFQSPLNVGVGTSVIAFAGTDGLIASSGTMPEWSPSGIILHGNDGDGRVEIPNGYLNGLKQVTMITGADVTAPGSEYSMRLFSEYPAGGNWGFAIWSTKDGYGGDTFFRTQVRLSGLHQSANQSYDYPNPILVSGIGRSTDMGDLAETILHTGSQNRVTRTGSGSHTGVFGESDGWWGAGTLGQNQELDGTHYGGLVFNDALSESDCRAIASILQDTVWNGLNFTVS